MAMEGSIDDHELEKFETGPDGAVIKVKKENAILPVQNADLGAAIVQAETLSTDDLNKISGTSNPQRGIADRATATESNIIAQEGSIRENKERDRLVKWLNRIGREVLLTARDKFTLGIFIEMESPEGAALGQDIQDVIPIWQWVATEDLSDGYDFKIDVDITTLSTTYQEQELNNMVKFLTILSQYPMVSFSPLLIREIAFRCGYRNMKVIRELQQMALLAELGRMQQLMPQQPGPVQQNIGAQMAPPNVEQIQNQIRGQLQNQPGLTQ
jgi:hypothetical protein